MISQDGFLLSYIKYGENDAVLHCFTEEDGFQTYFLKGIYSKKNKKKAFLLPLNKLNFSVNIGKSSGIQTVSKFEMVEVNDVYTDINANTVIFFIADFLNQILRNENQNQIIFHTIDEFIFELSQQNYRSHLILLVKILKIQGVSPLLGDGNYLDPETGTFSNLGSHHLFDSENSLLWKLILSSQDPYQIKIPQTMRKTFLDSVLVYYHYHITDFKTPNSLEIIQQIFE
ncbi:MULTISPECIES: DNA repair protein RecO [Chryseobacterium]|uniref:DNA repair protein RecO n=1 Tax=Chryseobacterium TaxID=59732 RepID=UPI001959EB5B|nr:MULTISPECIES: DNA repair protein RecO [Chryseobacterium]MBM7421540.1 DNA repair protein RecO (recombination protein O) [Chryseobacterium sp. JUb44]MDH6211507.1 DNA repair protein RecO (recombination protein O) [Chryseobacterium sp. BIGb0186]WSO10152.1 DNA repair protein RecO [Chryseobacterium scophthalmum]